MTDAAEAARRAGLAHDFRSPLNAIRGYAEMLKIRGDALNEAERAERLDTILTACDRLAALADRFVSAGAPGGADLATLAAAAVRLHTGRGPLTLSIDAATRSPADPLTVSRILDNLIDNALRHGGGAAVRVYEDRDRAVIVITDEGPGMTAAELAEALDPSRRGPRGGLGLPNARALAEEVGGALSVSTSPGAGLSARLVLPLDKGGDAGIDEPAQPQ